MATHPPGSGSPFLGFVAISGTLKALLVSGGVPAEYITVAHDGIDPSRFTDGLSPQEARVELLEKHIPALESGPPAEGLAELLAPDRPVIGYCGHFYEGRGIGMLIEAARRRPEWTFLFIGGFEADIAPYREQAREGKIGNVIFTGYVANPKLPPFLWACDILTMPYESAQGNSHFMSPMKMFEYMACGRAIVTADWPQIREVLTEGRNALFHPRGDVDAMEKCLERAVGDAGLRASLAAQARVDVEAHTWKERGRKIFGWLKERIANRG
jgi:glycosyltransferase involved in cell wall biosynthesis